MCAHHCGTQQQTFCWQHSNKSRGLGRQRNILSSYLCPSQNKKSTMDKSFILFCCFFVFCFFKPATNAGRIPIPLPSDAIHVQSLHTALWASEQMKWDVQEFVLQRGMCPSFILGCCLPWVSSFGLVVTAPPSGATMYSKVEFSFYLRFLLLFWSKPVNRRRQSCVCTTLREGQQDPNEEAYARDWTNMKMHICRVSLPGNMFRCISKVSERPPVKQTLILTLELPCTNNNRLI